MTPVLALLMLQADIAKGDQWSIERTYRYLNAAEGIDFTNIERDDYKVENPSTILVAWRLVATKFGEDSVPAAKDNTPQTAKLTFGPGGAPTYEEDKLDRIRARVERIQWAAAEERKGVSWTRKFPATAALPAAKITIRPNSPDRRTLSVSYLEDGGVKCEAVALIAPEKRIVASLKLTLVGVNPPGGTDKVDVAVNQSLVKK